MSTNNQQQIKNLQERLVFLERLYEFYTYAWLDYKTTGVTGPVVDHLDSMLALAKRQKYEVETYLNELIRLESEEPQCP